MQRYVPLEFVSSTAGVIIHADSPVACHNPSVSILAEQAEAIAKRSKCIPGEIGADAETADTALQ